jgi:hypothetical protein
VFHPGPSSYQIHGCCRHYRHCQLKPSLLASYCNAKPVGVFYLVFDLSTALMESVFHKHNWARTRRTITHSETKQRMVRAVGHLKLAD